MFANGLDAISPTEIPVHPIDMTEVYDIKDGGALCKGLFISNTDKRLREYLPGYAASTVP